MSRSQLPRGARDLLRALPGSHARRCARVRSARLVMTVAEKLRPAFQQKVHGLRVMFSHASETDDMLRGLPRTHAH